MSDREHDSKSSVNWGGWVKTILAGAAVVIGLELITGGMVSGMFKGGDGGAGKSFFTKEMMDGIGGILTKVGGVIIGGVGLSYLFSDKTDDNAERHGQHYNEAKESFAVREDMRKMQAVMVARMKANGHEPAMQGAGPSMA